MSNNISDFEFEQGTIVRKYIITQFLAQGQYGKVYLGINQEKNFENVAIKIVYLPNLQKSPKAYELFQTEIEIMKKIDNPNIVKQYDSFQENDHYFIVMEYCEQGDLGQLLREQQYFTESQAIEYLKQILNGMKGLHQKFIIHRDLKLPNILRKKGVIKIADLGFAKELKNDHDMTKSILGSACTMAPEIIERKEYGLESDMYSLGIILYQMLFGCYPYKGHQPKQLLLQAQEQQIDFNKFDIEVSPEIQQLIIQMTKYNREERLKFKEIFDNPIFLKENKSFQKINIDELSFTNEDNQEFINNKIQYQTLVINLKK